MPWFKVDDTLALHTKAVMAGNAAMGLWVRAGSWSMQTLSDGFIPDAIVGQLGTHAQAKKLVEVGLWDRMPTGYQILRDGPKPLWEGVVGDCRPRIPDELRRQVYERDGWACLHCGATDDLSLDHVWPYSRGGLDVLENLQTLCRLCNSKKGARV